jgi:signal transduction histidine kinase
VTLGLLAAAACVTVETVLAYPLERVAHASSLGTLYLLGVGAVSTLWGLRLGAATAVVSVLLWDHFQTPHVGIFSFQARDLLALAMFLGVALLVGSVADLARSRALEADARRREADLAAELARLLLRTQDLRSALPEAARRLAQTLGLPHAVIELDTVAGNEQQAALPLRDGTNRLGTLLVPADLAEPTQRRLRERIVPSLESLLRAARERQATGGALETSRDELRLLAEQQAALRRVATLVAHGVSPTRVFGAVAEQIGQILGAEFTEILRYGTDRAYTVVGSWTRSKATLSRRLGSRWPIEPRTVVEMLLRTERPARMRYGDDDSEVFMWLREHGITSVVGCPIMVEGRQWGAVTALSTGTEPQPADTEERMLEFTELVATAIANTESRDELRLLAEQQAALRRVATLVARGVSPTQLFRAVAEQMGEMLGAEFTEIIRHGANHTFTVAGSWTRGEPGLARPIDSRWPREPGTVVPLLLHTGRPARINFDHDHDHDHDGVIHRWVREQGITSVVGCPIIVEGRQWGAMVAFSTRAEPQPADTEERMREFTELVATAIANTESRTQLISSRARVVAAADETRRRIERDLHDGTQQRLFALTLELCAAENATPPELDKLRAKLHHTAQGMADAVKEVQEISRGIHPAIRSSGGIGPALKTLAHRSAIPVNLTVNADQRLAEHIEVAAYYIVSEALTNTAKHAHASAVHVTLNVQDTVLRLCVRDDGDGGADPNQGSGLTGLRDRVEALNGTIQVSSPAGAGTSLTVTIPIHNDLRAR